MVTARLLHGASSTAAWLRGAVRVTGPEAAERVRIARASRTVLADPVERLSRGELTYDHVRAIERGIRSLPPDQQHAGAQVLTDLARTASVADVRTAAAHLQYVLDPDGSLVDAQHQFDRRHLTMAPLMDGMTSLTGLLDPESAALLTAALQPFLVPTDANDDRSTPQRRADGLVQLVQSACDQALLPVSGGERPHLNVLVDPRTAQPDLGRWLLRDSAPGALPPGQLMGTPGAPRFLHPLSVARIVCDARLTALILNSDGVVVDLGRTQRLFSASQRRLLALRDGGCRFPGCERPAAHTDAHHVTPWHAGGPPTSPMPSCSVATTTVPFTKVTGRSRSTIPTKGPTERPLFTTPTAIATPATHAARNPHCSVATHLPCVIAAGDHRPHCRRRRWRTRGRPPAPPRARPCGRDMSTPRR